MFIFTTHNSSIGAEEKEVKFNDVLDHKAISSISEASSSVHKNESYGVEI